MDPPKEVEWKTRLSELSPRPRIAIALWVLIVLALSLLHLFLNARDIGHPELWLDESSTWNVARRPLLTVLTIPTQFHSQPPLYYVVLHFLMKIYDARWFLRGFGWVCTLLLVELVLLFAHELSLSARVVFCITFITANLTKYLSSALRPYGMAALTTFVATLMLLRFLREPTRRRAIVYAVWALVMLYTMAFDIWVGAAHGICVAIFLLARAFALGPRQAWKTYRSVVLTMVAVVVGYLPYLWMAAHWHYAHNAENNAPQLSEPSHYTYVANEHFGFSTVGMVLLYGLALVGMWGELRSRRPLSLVWPLIAVGQVAFVVYFMMGRGLGPTGRYITPALPAMCFLVALGWHHLARRVSSVAWQVLPIVLVLVLRPEYDLYAAYMKAPRPVGPFAKLRTRMKSEPGNKVIFFDVGYAGQDFEYVVRNDNDIVTATMPGEGGYFGGNDHLDPAYIEATILTNADAHCFYYQVENPNGVFATTFVPQMHKLGYIDAGRYDKLRWFCRTN